MIRIWNLDSLDTPQSMFGIKNFEIEIFILPNNKFILYTGRPVSDKHINIYDVHVLVTTLHGHNRDITSFGLRGTRLISAANGGEFKI